MIIKQPKMSGTNVIKNTYWQFSPRVGLGAEALHGVHQILMSTKPSQHHQDAVSSWN